MKVVIVGPTGVGKTKMSIELAKMFDAYIINADAVQVYKGLDIGSAKVTLEEMQGIKHFLIDIKTPDQEYSVKDYQNDLRDILDKYKDKNMVIVGGTGLYICAGLMDYRFYLDLDDDDFDKYSNSELYEMVLKKDKDTKIHPNNRVRLIRALKRKKESEVEPKLLYDDVYFIGLTTDRNNLYNIINNRVEEMFNKGLVSEVKSLYEKYPDSLILQRAIGYKEIISYLKGDVSLDSAKEAIKQNSRHYAKRQYTWFNNKMDVKWFVVNYDDFNKTIDEVKKYLTLS